MEKTADHELAHFAHDLRNLLTTVIGHADLQAESQAAAVDPALLGSLRSISASASRAAALCEEMLVQARDGEATLELIDLSEVAKSAGRLFEANIDRRIKFELIFCNEAMVLADFHRCERAVLNLLWNARDAVLASLSDDDGNRTGKIRLECAFNGGFVDLQVADSGAGLPEGRIGDLTSAFRSSQQDDQVRGLGLHSVAFAMASFSGKLLGDNNSEQGGARLTLQLPFQKKPNSLTNTANKV